MPIVLMKLFNTLNRISIQLKTKQLLSHHCGYHGNMVIKATRYITDVCCLMEALYYV